MTLLKGITVTLYQKTQTGTDSFNRPIYTETPVCVPNVLFAPSSTDDVVNQTNVTGKKEMYLLGLPKGDTHDWVNVRVKIGNDIFKTVGFPEEGIEALVPTEWHRKVKLERFNE